MQKYFSEVEDILREAGDEPEAPKIILEELISPLEALKQASVTLSVPARDFYVFAGITCPGIIGTKEQCQFVLAEAIAIQHDQFFDMLENSQGTEEESDHFYKVRSDLYDNVYKLVKTQAKIVDNDYLMWWPEIEFTE